MLVYKLTAITNLNPPLPNAITKLLIPNYEVEDDDWRLEICSLRACLMLLMLQRAAWQAMELSTSVTVLLRGCVMSGKPYSQTIGKSTKMHLMRVSNLWIDFMDWKCNWHTHPHSVICVSEQNKVAKLKNTPIKRNTVQKSALPNYWMKTLSFTVCDCESIHHIQTHEYFDEWISWGRDCLNSVHNHFHTHIPRTFWTGLVPRQNGRRNLILIF